MSPSERSEVDAPAALLYAALKRVMTESPVPGFYGPGSWWEQANDALDEWEAAQ
jgi:hypothetical protein